MKKIVKINNIEETYALSKTLSKHLKRSSIITLDGDLGAGKTTFTKELLKNLGVTQVVTSPTFNIMKIYHVDGLTFNHLDLYRLSSLGLDLDLEEYIYSDAISLVEWSQNVEELFDDSALRINISVVSEFERIFEIESKNQDYYEFIGEI